jgi:large subunit ribosomal protein L25
MKTLELAAELRTEVGKSSTKRLRKENKVPAAIYGLEQTLHVAVDEKELNKALFTPETYLIHLTVDGKVYKTIITGQKFHPLHDNVLDVEFFVVDEKRPIQVSLPLRLEGNSVGVLAGGKLVQKTKKLKVRGIYNQLPDSITVDITDLKLGRSLKVADLRFDGFAAAVKGDVPICSIEITRSLRQEAAAAAKASKN